ncbi:MAG: tetratricopeptide repeat protein [Sphingomonas sp.]
MTEALDAFLESLTDVERWRASSPRAKAVAEGTMMTTRTLLSLGLSALVLTGTMVGASTSGMIASAASAENPKRAATEAGAARKALAKRQADKAVLHAEAAVAYAPRAAEYRALLGQAYLLAGRFTSAKQALADALTLDPSDPHIALNLALAQIAGADWPGARGTLDAHEDIPASDRGLAMRWPAIR